MGMGRYDQRRHTPPWKRLRWNLGFTASQTDSEVVYLPANVTEYYNAYTWNSGNIRNGIMLGYPVTTITGRAWLRNDAGDVIISPTTGTPVVNANWTVIGNREPKLRYGITSALSYKGLRLSAMFSALQGYSRERHKASDDAGRTELGICNHA
jgi:hypothetical protein